MIRLAFNNVNCYIEHDGTPEDIQMITNIRHALSYYPKGARFIPGNHHLSKPMSFLYEEPNGKYSMFPTGHIHFLLNSKHKRKIKNPDGTLGDRFENYEVTVDEIIDRRVELQPVLQEINLWNEKENKPLELFDHQKEAIDIFLEKKRGIVRVAMGGGKTVIAIALAQILGLKTLFIIHSKDLVKQTIREFKAKANIDAGMIGDSVWNPREVTVSTIQTLSRRLKEKYVQDYLKRVEFLIHDEAHHASNSYQKISRSLKNAYYRLSLSATVGMGNKEEKLRSMAMTDEIIYDIEMSELVDNKRLAKPTALFIKIPRMADDPRWDLMGYEEQYNEGIVQNEFRNLILVQAAVEIRKQGCSSLVLVEKLQQGENLLEFFNEFGLKTKYISGKDKSAKREEAATDLQIGDLDVLLTSRIFNEGKDLPSLESVIVASGYKKAGLTFQRAGRGVRKTLTKDHTLMVDCLDDFAPDLKKHSDARLATIKKNKAFEVVICEWNEVEKTIRDIFNKRRGKCHIPK